MEPDGSIALGRESLDRPICRNCRACDIGGSVTCGHCGAVYCPACLPDWGQCDQCLQDPHWKRQIVND